MSFSILIVDDSRTIRVQLAKILSAAGFETLIASTGKEALAVARGEKPNLVILDIQMPEMDGYTVCQELKSMGPPCGQLPVIFLTSLRSHALDLLGNEMGAYLRKPIDRVELLETVNRFVPVCHA